jgi:hypothetical protein
MNAQVNAAELWSPRSRRNLAIAVIALALCACGGDDDTIDVGYTPSDAGADSDGGGGDLPLDGEVPLPITPDAGEAFPGEPPPELADSLCAVDTNKVYDLITLDRPPAPTQLAVDQTASRFGSVFVGDSEQCIDALYLANLEGASGVGEPEITLATDECTTVTHSALAHTGAHWLLAMVDARMDSYDLWVQAHDGDDQFTAHRISENLGQESDLSIAAVGDDAAIVVWVERDALTGATSLNARPLDADGTPSGDAVVLEPAGTWSFASVTVGRIGEYAGLGYRRFDAGGRSEIVLDVLSAETAERDRDSWVLTSEAGPVGSVELGSDDDGGGVIYSIGQAESQQLWFQKIDRTGRAAKIMSGINVGGDASPQRVVGPPYKANDASLAKLPVGFAVAYRALPGGMVTSPRIRVHFLDRDGRIIGVSDVALAGEFGGRTAIEAAVDGRIVLGWTDTAEDGSSTLTAVKLPCVGGG